MQSYRLGEFKNSIKATKEFNYYENYLQNYEVDYPDCNPIWEVSLVDLNSRLKTKMKMEYFKTKIVVMDSKAFEDDAYDEILIGDIDMKTVLSCTKYI
ncbi:MOSC domain-containing protein 2 [Cricetulus griseus]|nr:MOSC domain-containing protein 2 [Cricetulus griseus]